MSAKKTVNCVPGALRHGQRRRDAQRQHFAAVLARRREIEFQVRANAYRLEQLRRFGPNLHPRVYELKR